MTRTLKAMSNRDLQRSGIKFGHDLNQLVIEA